MPGGRCAADRAWVTAVVRRVPVGVPSGDCEKNQIPGQRLAKRALRECKPPNAVVSWADLVNVLGHRSRLKPNPATFCPDYGYMTMKARYAFERHGTGLALLPDSYSVSFAPDGPAESALAKAEGAVCAVSGCTRPVFVEIGRRHPFCSRRCAALEASRQAAHTEQGQRAQAARLNDAEVCALAGCARLVFVEMDGRRHPFCSRGHAALAAAGVVAGSDTCSLAECTRPVHVSADGQRHPFCGLTHAEHWLSDQVAARAAADIAHWPEGGAHPYSTTILHPRTPSALNPNPQNPKPQPLPKEPQ